MSLFHHTNSPASALRVGLIQALGRYGTRVATVSIQDLTPPSSSFGGFSPCSAELGLEASRQWIAGEPRTTPRGNPLEGLWSESYWTAPLEASANNRLEGALAQIAQWLEEHAQFFATHARSGGSAELFIGFFLESFNSGFSLEPELLAKYSLLGVALEFDMYGADDEPRAA